MSIPFIDLAKQQEAIRHQITAAISRVMDHGKYIMGPEVRQLEEQLAEFVGVKHCIGVSNGTDALSMALMALNVGPGDAVITTPFTFFATVETIMLRGAIPVFADICPRTYNICSESVAMVAEKVRQEKKLTLRAIIPVDLYGLSADYAKLKEVLPDNLAVIQDSAQAFGAVSRNTRCPAHGDIGTTSFFPAKPLGCYGDGGAVFTDRDDWADVVRSIRVHGKGTDKYDNIRLGLNARLDTIQAAILIEKFKIYPTEMDLRQQVAEHYQAAIGEMNSRLPTDRQVKTQHIPASCKSAWAQFVIQTPRRTTLSEKLSEAGIPTVVYYRTPAHKLKACKGLDQYVPLPVSEQVANEILALPFHPYLEQATIDRIIGVIEKALQDA